MALVDPTDPVTTFTSYYISHSINTVPLDEVLMCDRESQTDGIVVVMNSDMLTLGYHFEQSAIDTSVWEILELYFNGV
jgi:hypothetical protein